MRPALAALAVAVATVCLPAVAGADEPGFVTPPTFARAKALEPAASYVAGKPAQVWCTKTYASWNSFVRQVFGVSEPGANGMALPGGAALYIAPDECNNLLFAVQADPQDANAAVKALAGPIETLTHEAIHLRGESDEGITDCDAMHEMPGVAVRHFHITPGKHLRALMAAAWIYHRQSPAAYTAVC